MTRKGKRPDATEMHEQMRDTREFQARKIRDEFPNVNCIRIVLSFEDYDQKTGPKSRELMYSQESRAFFEMKCPYYECVMGGFDFSSPIRKAVSDRLSLAKGSVTCRGWQDRERIHKNHCYLKANYEIHVEYAV